MLSRRNLVPLIVLSLFNHATAYIINPNGVPQVKEVPIAVTPANAMAPVEMEMPMAMEVPLAVPVLEFDTAPLEMGATSNPYTTVDPNATVVREMIDKFMQEFTKDMAATALEPKVVSIVKAEKSDTQLELAEEEGPNGALAVEHVASEQYRILLLLKYRFLSSMLTALRPYVSVLELNMNCLNASTPATPASSALACSINSRRDMLRQNETLQAMPSYVPQMIAKAAPASLQIDNPTEDLIFDAFEVQDLSPARGYSMSNELDRNSMRYVRFRVRGGNSQDCMIVIEHTKRTNTLQYQDDACFATTEVTSSISSARFSKENVSMFIFAASLVGAVLAICFIWRGRLRQRTGYSYVHSGIAKKAATKSSVDTDNDSSMSAVAC